MTNAPLRLGLMLALLAISSCSYLGCRPAAEPQAEAIGTDAPLTVEQSLALAVQRPMHGARLELIARAHPAAAPALRRLLADRGRTIYHEQAWMCLGTVGDAGDVRLAEQALAAYRESYGLAELNAIRGLITALGAMGRRGVPGAREQIERMQTVAFWREPPFRMRAPATRDEPRLRNPDREFWHGLLLADANTGAPGFEGRARRLLEQDPDVADRPSLAKMLASGHFATACATRRAAEVRPIPERDRRNLDAVFRKNEDMLRPLMSGQDAEEAGLAPAPVP